MRIRRCSCKKESRFLTSERLWSRSETTRRSIKARPSSHRRLKSSPGEIKKSRPPTLPARSRRRRKEQRCPWSDFAVLYRLHNHREELVKELVERGIPFSIEGLDVLHTPEVRDVVACLSAAVSLNDAASLFRVAALPQFAHQPHRTARRHESRPRGELDLRTVFGKLANGPAVLASVREGARAGGQGRSPRRRRGEHSRSGTLACRGRLR